MARTVAIVQARMGSTRLPGKVLLEAAGQSLLAHLIGRLRQCHSLTEIVVATTQQPGDDILVQACAALGVRVVRGSTDDVLQRFADTVRATGADIVVRVTADCPLMAPDEVDRVVAILQAGNADYVSNQLPGKQKLPLGFAVEAMRADAILLAERDSTLPHEREHVTPFMYAPQTPLAVGWAEPSIFAPDLRVTVDTPADFEVVSAVLQAIGDTPQGQSAQGVVSWLRAHPQIARRNADVQQKSHREIAGEWLLLRADASVAGGTGHVMRMLGIGEAWISHGGQAVLLSHQLPAALAQRFSAIGVSSVALPAGTEPGTAQDAAWIVSQAEQRHARIVLVDGYAFAPPWLAALHSSDLKVAYVDDYGDPALRVDLVVMPNVGAKPPPGHRLPILSGQRYTPVRREFEQLPARDYSSRGANNLLLIFGGSDPAGMTERAIAAVRALHLTRPLLRCTAVVGPAHPRAAQLQGQHEPWLQVVSNVTDMAGLLQSIDVACTAAGTTCWELCAAGVPMVVVQVADNQATVVQGITQGGAGWALPAADQLTPGDLLAGLRRLVTTNPVTLQAMSTAGQRMIDGLGAKRIASALSRIAAGASL